jgi:hypothetical protein
MVQDGLVDKQPALTRYPLLELDSPLDAWAVGMPRHFRGDPEAISYQAQKRWANLGTRLVSVYVATPLLTKREGGVARGSKPLQVTHDLHLFQIFKSLSSQAQAAWQGEDYLRATRRFGRRQVIPDALIGNIMCDFLGAYEASRIAELQDFAMRNELSYVLW